jgi:hypothetical protein
MSPHILWKFSRPWRCIVYIVCLLLKEAGNKHTETAPQQVIWTDCIGSDDETESLSAQIPLRNIWGSAVENFNQWSSSPLFPWSGMRSLLPHSTLCSGVRWLISLKLLLIHLQPVLDNHQMHISKPVDSNPHNHRRLTSWMDWNPARDGWWDDFQLIPYKREFR